jgi:hypothetical protein
MSTNRIDATCSLLSEAEKALQIFGGFDCCRRFDSHGEECAKEENGGAPQLRVSETFPKNPGGERQRAGGTEQLERLRESNADLADGDVVQDMGKRNAAHRRDDKSEINMQSHVKRSVDLSERASKRE